MNSCIKIPIYNIYLKSICLLDQKYNDIFIIYLKSIKSMISGNVINCCLASSALNSVLNLFQGNFLEKYSN
jgi:hypothetical protein